MLLLALLLPLLLALLLPLQGCRAQQGRGAGAARAQGAGGLRRLSCPPLDDVTPSPLLPRDASSARTGDGAGKPAARPARRTGR